VPTKTRQELVRRALNKLGAIGAGQAPSAEDGALADGAVDPVLSDLSIRNIYAYGDPDHIEPEAFEHLADCIVFAIARDFGQMPDNDMRLLAESRLRQQHLTGLSGQPQRAEYI
jgi:hypothetical protein